MSAGLVSMALASMVLLASSPVDVLEPAFRNTIVSLYPDGKSTKTWLFRDGRYEGVRANGQHTAGIWRLKGEKLCLVQKQPIYVPLNFCTAIPPAGGVGASWVARGLKGEPVRHTLSAGR